MSEVRGRNRATKPIPHLTIEPPWDSRLSSYVMTQEQLAEVIEKYGAPTMPLSSRRQAMHMQRPKPKKVTE